MTTQALSERVTFRLQSFRPVSAVAAMVNGQCLKQLFLHNVNIYMLIYVNIYMLIFIYKVYSSVDDCGERSAPDFA